MAGWLGWMDGWADGRMDGWVGWWAGASVRGQVCGVASSSSSLLRFVVARVDWQWFSWLEERAPAGKQLLRLNLDETSVCIYPGREAGSVFISKRKAPVESAPASKRRRCMTHVAVVCDRADLQPLLPQFIIGNEVLFLPFGAAAFFFVHGTCGGFAQVGEWLRGGCGWRQRTPPRSAQVCTA